MQRRTRWFLAALLACSVCGGCAFTRRLDMMLVQLGGMNRKFDRLDGRMAEMNEELDEIDRKMESVARLANRFEQEFEEDVE
ncbi:MAG: hypothetical protein KY475_04175 [Planctomycetes bacterium]|nr:hypothetical protein [Planctomycetota bacterium]